jgi:hypothetical protein
LLPGIVKSIRFKPNTQVSWNVYTYVEFKTEIVCGGKPTIDLNSVPDALND